MTLLAFLLMRLLNMFYEAPYFQVSPPKQENLGEKNQSSLTGITPAIRQLGREKARNT